MSFLNMLEISKRNLKILLIMLERSYMNNIRILRILLKKVWMIHGILQSLLKIKLIIMLILPKIIFMIHLMKLVMLLKINMSLLEILVNDIKTKQQRKLEMRMTLLNKVQSKLLRMSLIKLVNLII